MIGGLSRLHTGLLDLFFPRRCVGCGAVGDWVCSACSAGVLARGEEDGIKWLFAFETAVVRELLLGLKYLGLRDMAGSLVGLAQREVGLAELKAWLGIGGDGAVLIPVPISKDRRKKRGYNQAEELALALGAWLDLPVWAGALEKAKGSSLVGKSADERRLQAAASFVRSKEAVPEWAVGKRWIVIDDVSTTGSTLGACMQVLESGNQASIGGLAMAKEL